MFARLIQKFTKLPLVCLMLDMMTALWLSTPKRVFNFFLFCSTTSSHNETIHPSCLKMLKRYLMNHSQAGLKFIEMWIDIIWARLFDLTLMRFVGGLNIESININTLQQHNQVRRLNINLWQNMKSCRPKLLQDNDRSVFKIDFHQLS